MYLLMYKKADGSHLKPGTAVQYLSGWKTALSRKFPKVIMLKEKHPDSLWYGKRPNAKENRGCGGKLDIGLESLDASGRVIGADGGNFLGSVQRPKKTAGAEGNWT